MNNFPIIDLHVHFRENPKLYYSELKKFNLVAASPMPNTKKCLDTKAKILNYCRKIKFLQPLPISAITIDRVGKKLVEIEKIKLHVLGFSDDGNCLKNLKLLTKALSYDIIILCHLEPEVEMAKKYIEILQKVQKGYLYFQHVSKKETVKLIRKAKKMGLKIFAETCPQYFSFDRKIENIVVNPPIGDASDVKAIIQGLKDGTIDCIASDFAPLPRPKNTGFASYFAFTSLCFGLAQNKYLTEKQLEEKMFLNPLKIIRLANSKIYKELKKKLAIY